MILQYLGTGAAEAVPALFCRCDLCEYARVHGGKDVRTRSGAMIDGKLMIDFPPDTYMHLRTFGIDITGIEHLLITHPHEDHYAFAELAYRTKGFGQLNADDKALTVYGGVEVGELLAKRLEGRPKGTVAFQLLRAFETANIGGYRVTPLPANHMLSAQAFIYLIEKDGRVLLYAHDTAMLFDEVFDYLAGREIDFASIDCTYMNLPGSDSHMGVPIARKLRDRLLSSDAATKATRFAVNHFSHNGGLTHEQLTQVAPEFIVSYDGLCVEV